MNKTHSVGIEDYLQKEKWTRMPVSEFTVTMFEELHDVVQLVKDEDEITSTLTLCESILEQNKQSIMGLYAMGILSLQRHSVHDNYIIQLIKIFVKQQRWNIVEYIANVALVFGENLDILYYLSHAYEEQNDMDKLIEVWNRISLLDFDNSTISNKLAQYYKNTGNHGAYVQNLKKVFSRSLNKKDYKSFKEVCEEFVENDIDDIENMFHVSHKHMLRAFDETQSTKLFQLFLDWFLKRENYKESVQVLKLMLSCDADNLKYREQLVDVYRKYYADVPSLEEFIKISNITQNWRNVHEAINDFEKHISFSVGNFVFHRKWGGGRVRKITRKTLTIDFIKKRNHIMDIGMAVSSLDVLPKNHIWILRNVISAERLRKKALQDPRWAIEIIINSFEGASLKQIKNEMVPIILTSSQWNVWSKKVKHILDTDPYFSIHSEHPDKYVLRNFPISMGEKTLYKFNAESQFYVKIQVLQEYIDALTKSQRAVDDSDIETMWTMVSYFSAFLDSIQENSSYDELVFASYFICESVSQFVPLLKKKIKVIDIRKIAMEMPKPVLASIVHKLSASHYAFQIFMVLYKIPEWEEYFLLLLPQYLDRSIVIFLMDKKHDELLQKVFVQMNTDIDTFRMGFIWYALNCQEDEWFIQMKRDKITLISDLLRARSSLVRDIEARFHAQDAKKWRDLIDKHLLKKGMLMDVITSSDKDTVSNLYSIVHQKHGLDSTLNIAVKNHILSKFPDFEFKEVKEQEVVSTGFFATMELYKQKQQELLHIQDVEVGENSKEIEKARSFGDLRENAEYKAAMEKQDSLNSRAAKIKEELRKAIVPKKSEVSATHISFGSVVTVQNKITQSRDVITILGPWESDPENKVISYLSPLGKKLYKNKIDSELQFSINDTPYHFFIESLAVSERLSD